MSALTGPPPPPSPPPPPPPPSRKSFNSLPAELLLNIIRFLQILDFTGLVLAIYPILQAHGIAPPMTHDIYTSIMNGQANAHAQDVQAEGSSTGPISRVALLPNEIHLMIMNHLSPTERLAWLMSDTGLLSRYFPEVDDETMRRLWDLVGEGNGD